MELKKGNPDNLIGNAVVYWRVEGENFMNPNHEIIASNFVISAIPMEEKLFSAVFPPITFKNHDEFFTKIVNVHCDILYGGKIRFPQRDKGFKTFLKRESEKYNMLIEEYTNKYRLKFNFDTNSISEREQLYLLDELSGRVRVSISKGEYSKEKNKTGSDPDKILKIINNLKNKDNKYDVDHFLEMLYQPGKNFDDLVSLYTKKFLAVYYEDYETAKKLTDKIKNIENGIL